MTTLEATITAVATRCLHGCRPDQGHLADRGNSATLEGDMPLALLGLDSLATIELAAALEDELGCTLPADILVDCTDARSLAARLAPLARLASQAPLGGGDARRADARRADDRFDQMMADAVLPDDIWPAPARVHADVGLRHARTILLTGATGFLGSALLDELLDTSHATIVCLVRPTSPPIRRPETCRIRTITGDLSHPRLGLSESTYDALTRDVDAVCHAAAAVNWVFSYAGLRAANVLGTRELLRFACRAGAPFHFVSSLSTCYATSGPRTVDEDFDALSALRGIPLGYAQTKVVGEALAREAGSRGLPVRIYRPALISGHSRTGAFNRDDLLSRLVRGCVHMGIAPDLDWKLDCEPVDIVAKAIVDLSTSPETVFHLGHVRPRHWRECVLWMRMYGYHVRLVSYHAWLRRLDRETVPGAAGSDAHPLRPLRSFFLDRPADARGLTMPEVYEESRRTRAVRERTQALRLQFANANGATGANVANTANGANRANSLTCPDLDAALLETYFAAFRASGDLPDPPLPGPARRAREQARGRDRSAVDVFDTRFLSRVIGATVQRVEILRAGSDHSIVSELTAWRSKRPTGPFQVRLVLDDGPRDVFIKIKALDSDVMAVGAALADLVDPAVARAYRRHIDRTGFAASDAREIAVYRQTDRRVTAHLPRVIGTAADEASGTWVVVLEDVRGAAIVDSVDRPEDWGHAEIRAAIDGLAALHAAWLGRDDELRRRPWIGHVRTARSVEEMTDLWRALADHAAPRFAAWADPDIAQIHQRLVAGAGDWWQPLEAGPRTLIHHDFNPRNVCLRSTATGWSATDGARLRLCAYDWELATLGAPQRDLAEFLCFVLTDRTTAHAGHWIEHHRVALERASGQAIDAEQWTRGFRSALYDVLIDRLAMYALVHRVRRQSFLPRVVRTWRRLYQQFPLDGVA
jgi:thioester reductase-like protein